MSEKCIDAKPEVWREYGKAKIDFCAQVSFLLFPCAFLLLFFWGGGGCE